MRAHLRYLRYVLRHKWFVFQECCRLGIPLAGVIHDWSKFLPSEWAPYVRFFYGRRGEPVSRRDSTGYYKPTDTGDEAFDFAWLLHQKRNPHHWQWWCLPEDQGGTKVLAMPDRYRREMVADWRGAGRAQGTPDVLRWYESNRHKMLLHPDTRQWIEAEIGFGMNERGAGAGQIPTADTHPADGEPGVGPPHRAEPDQHDRAEDPVLGGEAAAAGGEEGR